MQALAAAGAAAAPLDDAVGYLRRAQNGDGGFGQFEGRSSNAQSTAYAVQGLVAAGRNPGRFRKGGNSPIGYLRARQNGDGSVDYSRVSAQTPVWVTAQAVMALAAEAAAARPGAAASRARCERIRSGGRRRPPRRGRSGKPKADGDEPRQSRGGGARPKPAQASDGWTPYAPLDNAADEPGAARGGDGAGPSWLGVALTLAAAALAYYVGRRVRRASVTAKRTATAA